MATGGHRAIPVVIALALACVVVAGVKLSAKWRATDAVVLPPPACDLSNDACSAPLPQGGRLTLSIEPRPIRPLQPLALNATLTGANATRLKIDFDGVDMRMGYNRPTLTGDGKHFTGTTTLPVCVTGTMTWKATVLITTDTGRIAQPFRFVVPGR